VRAGLHGGHGAALVAVEGPIHAQRLQQEGVLRDLEEDLLRVERPVVVADARVVAADDQVAAAVVLAEDRVQERLAGTRVAHVERVAGHGHALLAEVLVDQGVDRLHPDVGGYVTGLQLAHELVDVHAVADLDGDPGQVGVGAVHGIAQLQRRHRVPAALLEHLARLGGPLIEALELLGEVRLGEHLHGAGQVYLGLIHHHLDARVRHVGGPEDLLALVLLVDGVLLGHLHGGHQRVRFGVPERDLLADLDGVGEGFPRREGDGDRPEEAVLGRHLVRVADALPVRLPHEAVEGRESPDPQHDEVAGLAAGQRDLLEAVRLLALVLARLPFEEQALELLASVRVYELSHRMSSFSRS
jgi:hypothetical protein